MTTLLLTFCLILSGNSCAGRFAKNTSHVSSQTDATFLSPLLEQVDSSSEPALRIFLRLKIATYLWGNSSRSHNPEAVAAAALADLHTHEKEIPALYVDLFRRDLIAELKAHAPDSAARLLEEYKLERHTDIEVAYSLLGQEDGVDKAVGIVQRSIAGGNDPGSIIVPFLHRLEKTNPAGVLKVIDAIMLAEESRPGSISARTLFALKHLFIREQTPQGLQRRYLVSVINRAGETEASPASVVDIYTILADVLPAVEKQAPDLYHSASAWLSQLAMRVPGRTLERLSINKRVSQSTDPLAQLLAERDAVNDQSLREELQTEAAQLALEKGQIQMAIQLVIKLRPKNEEARMWRDQFIEEAVGRAVEKGDVAVAEYGASQIQSAGVRSSALQKLALYFQASSDPLRARDTLNSALKLTEASDDDAEKAVALLDLAHSFLKVDSQRALVLARAAVKTINKTPAVMRKAEAGSDTHLGDVENMMKIAYRIVPTFQALGATGQSTALELAEDIQRQELKTAAKFGAYTGSPTVGKNKQVVASN